MSTARPHEIIFDNPLLKQGTELVCPDVSTLTDIATLPAYADIHLGKYFSFVDIDENATIERLTQEGLSLADIAVRHYILSAQTHMAEGETLHGEYDPESGNVTVYPLESLRSGQDAVAAYLKAHPELQHASMSHPAGDVSMKSSTTLYHEIRHLRQDIVDDTQEDADTEYKSQLKVMCRLGEAAAILFAIICAGSVELFSSGHMTSATHLAASAIALVGFGMTAALSPKVAELLGHRNYYNHPLEKDAREAENDLESYVVIAVPKKEYTGVMRQTGTMSRRGFFKALTTVDPQSQPH